MPNIFVHDYAVLFRDMQHYCIFHPQLNDNSNHFSSSHLFRPPSCDFIVDKKITALKSTQYLIQRNTIKYRNLLEQEALFSKKSEHNYNMKKNIPNILHKSLRNNLKFAGNNSYIIRIYGDL